MFVSPARTFGVSAANWHNHYMLTSMLTVLATPWLGAHVLINSVADLDACGAAIPAMARSGVNTIVVEVDYSYRFKSRPEIAQKDGVSFESARRFAKVCRDNKVRVIPEVNCLGHQSWAKVNGALLRTHPELDETPGKYPENKGIYCRSWCPLHPDIPKIVFPLVDELIDAFQATAFHVGMDEVFLIGTPDCVRCNGKSPSELFAKAVKDFHDHLSKKRIQMLMWGDRLLDGKANGLGEWEAAVNGTAPAIDLIPKDIIVCDWHYETRTDYPSIKILVDKGFKVWISTFKNEPAASAFSKQGFKEGRGRVIGALSTNWYEVKPEALPTWPPLVATFAPWR